jgi:hypothetical protein
MVTGVIQRTPSDLDTLSKSELLEWAERNGLSSNNTVAFELGRLYVSSMRSLVQFCVEKGIDQDRLNAALDERETIAIQDAKAQRNTTLEYLNQKEGTKTLHEGGKEEEKISLEEKLKRNQIIAQSSSIATLYQQIVSIQQNSMEYYFESRPSKSSTPALYQMKRLVDDIVSNFREKSTSSISSSSATSQFQQKIIEFLAKEKLEKEKEKQEKNKTVEGNKEKNNGNKKNGGNKKGGKSVLEVRTTQDPVKEAVRIFRASKSYVVEAFTKIKTKLREFYVEYTVTQKERVFCDLSSFESFKERISHYSPSILSSKFGFSPTYNAQTQIDTLLVGREKNCETSCINFKLKEESVESKISESKQKVLSIEEKLENFREIVHFLEKLIDVKVSNNEISSKKNERDAQTKSPKSSETNILGKGAEKEVDTRLEITQLNVTKFLEQPKIQQLATSTKMIKTTYLTLDNGKSSNAPVSFSDSLSQIISFLFEVKDFKGTYDQLSRGIKNFLDRKNIRDTTRGKNVKEKGSSQGGPKQGDPKKEISNGDIWEEKDKKRAKETKDKVGKYDSYVDIKNEKGRGVVVIEYLEDETQSFEME